MQGTKALAVLKCLLRPHVGSRLESGEAGTQSEDKDFVVYTKCHF